MAEYKLGDLEFETEQEYNDATSDLKRIKSLMSEYNVNTKEDALKVLELLKSEEQFKSDYGKKFLEKLKKNAGMSEQPAPAAAPSGAEQEKPAEKPAPKKRRRRSRRGKGIHIITKRNIIIGVAIIVILVVVKFATGISFNRDETTETKRRMVLLYAQTQLDLKDELREYYKKVDGVDSDTALDKADTFLTENYVLNLTEENVFDFGDEEISEIYVKLLTGGDLDANGFNEPQAVTNIKTEIGKVLSSGAVSTADDSADVTGDTIISVINEVVEYQYRVYNELKYGYGKLGIGKEEAGQMAEDDLEQMFGHVIFDSILNDSEKEAYYNDFVKRGLVRGSNIVEFGSNPSKELLPDLTPKVDISIPGGNYTAECVQMTPNVGASVAYTIKVNGNEGAVVFRNNADGSAYIQIEGDNSVALQGDFFIYIEGNLVNGEWYYDGNRIGLFIDDQKGYFVSNVYELSF
ncbi:MAG: hypothetical protein K6E56_02985 [Lachnospiraceae bacterium]|nr:hypothetical protein [Lachnospiraceae bacterium]